MLGRLDRYVLRTLLISWLVCSLFLLGLFVLFRVLNDSNELVRARAALTGVYQDRFLLHALQYYLVDLPFLFLELGPFLTVFAAMFAVSQLMAQNEVVPMVFTGRSVHRILLPVFALAVGSAALMIGIREFLLPQLQDTRQFLKGLVLEGKVDRGTGQRVLLLDDGRALKLGGYRPRSTTMDDVKLWDRVVEGDDTVFVAATSAQWDPQRAAWVTTGGFRMVGKVRQDIDHLDLPPRVTPEWVWLQCRDPQELMDVTYSELTDLMRKRPTVRQYAVAFHTHLTFPLANLVLLLLALPCALRFERGSKTERVVAAVLICAAFLTANILSQRFGNAGMIHPVYAAWLPTLVFGSLAVVFYDTIRT